METDLKKEIVKRDQLIAGLEKEIQLRSQLINQQKEMIEMLVLLTTGFVQNYSGFFVRNQTGFLSARDFYLNFWRTFFYNSLRCTNAQATVAASTFFKCRDRRSRFQKISE